MRFFRPLTVANCVLFLWSVSALRGQAPPECEWSPGDDAQWLLFECETTNHKQVRFCGDRDPKDDDHYRWIHINYRFGPKDGPPEFIFPAHPESASPPFFYSEGKRANGDDVEVIRFSNGAYTYRVFYGLEANFIYDGHGWVPTPRPHTFAWVDVEAKGKTLSHIGCRTANIFRDMSGSLPYDPDKAAEEWAEVRDSTNPEALEAFAERFSNTELARVAEARAGNLRSNAAKASKDK